MVGLLQRLQVALEIWHSTPFGCIWTWGISLGASLVLAISFGHITEAMDALEGSIKSDVVRTATVIVPWSIAASLLFNSYSLAVCVLTAASTRNLLLSDRSYYQCLLTSLAGPNDILVLQFCSFGVFVLNLVASHYYLLLFVSGGVFHWLCGTSEEALAKLTEFVHAVRGDSNAEEDHKNFWNSVLPANLREHCKESGQNIIDHLLLLLVCGGILCVTQALMIVHCAYARAMLLGEEHPHPSEKGINIQSDPAASGHELQRKIDELEVELAKAKREDHGKDMRSVAQEVNDERAPLRANLQSNTDDDPKREIIEVVFEPDVPRLALVIEWAPDRPFICEIEPDGIADKLGLEELDEILAISGKDTRGAKREDLLPLLHERPVVLKVERVVEMVEA